ncbi:regulator of microtubule dynamics protein 1 isoform X2 [Latimeria chalumnae]|uniref:regulator of microtubule dynamics protein 1 isoform X2 n=1 Tax=Latimeria chalumnae TaxID=7897 RepID=UPI00313BE258
MAEASRLGLRGLTLLKKFLLKNVCEIKQFRSDWLSCRARLSSHFSRGENFGSAWLLYLKRGLTLPLLSILGYEVYRNNTCLSVVNAVNAEAQEIIEQADYLYGSGETQKLYQLLIKRKNSENAELLWRLARASRDLAQLSSTTAEDKKALTFEALEFAKKALEKKNSFAAHKWYAICISDVGEYKGIKEKISDAYIIKEHFEKAIQLNPKDATSIHLLGLWCFTFAEMPWYQQKIAALVFEKPPSSTYEEALSYFSKAEEVDPNFYSKNLLMLGITCLKLRNEKMAILWLTKARDHPSHTEEDKRVQKEAQEMLKTLGIKS